MKKSLRHENIRLRFNIDSYKELQKKHGINIHFVVMNTAVKILRNPNEFYFEKDIYKMSILITECINLNFRETYKRFQFSAATGLKHILISE